MPPRNDFACGYTKLSMPIVGGFDAVVVAVDDFSAAIPTTGEMESAETRAHVRQSVRMERAISNVDACASDLVSFG